MMSGDQRSSLTLVAPAVWVNRTAVGLDFSPGNSGYTSTWSQQLLPVWYSMFPKPCFHCLKIMWSSYISSRGISLFLEHAKLSPVLGIPFSWNNWLLLSLHTSAQLSSPVRGSPAVSPKVASCVPLSLYPIYLCSSLLILSSWFVCGLINCPPPLLSFCLCCMCTVSRRVLAHGEIAIWTWDHWVSLNSVCSPLPRFSPLSSV